MLGTLALLEGIEDGERVYDIIFVVVAFSVLVQGTSIPYVASRLGVPMRDSDPGGVVRRVVSAGSSAAGRTLRDLPLGERTWVRAVTRDGRAAADSAAARCSRRGTTWSSCSTSATSTGSTTSSASEGREGGRGGREAAAGRG